MDDDIIDLGTKLSTLKSAISIFHTSLFTGGFKIETFSKFFMGKCLSPKID